MIDAPRLKARRCLGTDHGKENDAIACKEPEVGRALPKTHRCARGSRSL